MALFTSEIEVCGGMFYHRRSQTGRFFFCPHEAKDVIIRGTPIKVDLGNNALTLARRTRWREHSQSSICAPFWKGCPCS